MNMAAVAARDRARRYYLGIAVLLAVIVAAGFVPGYFARAASGERLPAFVHVHAAVFSLWLGLLLAQVLLVRAGRVDLHRRIGTSAMILVPFMLALGLATIIYGARRGHPFWKDPERGPPPGVPFADSLEFMAVPFGDLVLFAGFVVAALYFRRRPELHKRLMILAAIGGMLWPAITRIPPIAGTGLWGLAILVPLLLAGPVRDLWLRRRVHPVDVWGGALIVASFPARRLLAGTELWHTVAEWLTR